MPVFDVTYTRPCNDKTKEFSILVKACSVADAVAQLEDRHENATIKDVLTVGKVLNSPSVPTAPTWTSKNGVTKKISKIKTGNLRAILRTLESKGLGEVGIANEIRAELSCR